MKPLILLNTLCASLAFTAHLQAQTPAPVADTQAPKMSRYERTHGGTPGVFRRDPNVWVMTPEVAERSGMPKAWASSELKGVAAAAFRREPQGAEADCGFGGNKNACQPVVNCVLELYFDRNTHLLPWREGSLVADYNHLRTGSSADHGDLWGRDHLSGARARKHLGLFADSQPFTDPASGQGLFWGDAASPRVQVHPEVDFVPGAYRPMAYDREIHGSYSYLKLDHGCGGHPKTMGVTLQLISKMDMRREPKDRKPLHEIFLPASWSARVGDVVKQNRQQEESFYKDIFESLPKGPNK